METTILCLCGSIGFESFERRGSGEQGYGRMPWLKRILANYLFPGTSSLMKAPSLPSNPCQVTLRLMGRAYAAAGQTGWALHTMAVLHGYWVKTWLKWKVYPRGSFFCSSCHQAVGPLSWPVYGGDGKASIRLNFSGVKESNLSNLFCPCCLPCCVRLYGLPFCVWPCLYFVSRLWIITLFNKYCVWILNLQLVTISLLLCHLVV